MHVPNDGLDDSTMDMVALLARNLSPPAFAHMILESFIAMADEEMQAASEPVDEGNPYYVATRNALSVFRQLLAELTRNEND